MRRAYVRIDRSTTSRFEKELSTHEQNHILHEGLRLPDGDVELQRDPAAYPNTPMWRDVVRRQLKFEPLMVDFLKITLLPLQKVVYNFLDHDLPT